MAGFIGRVGALAVALGVGLAVVTTPGVAIAETGDGDPVSGAEPAETEPDPREAEPEDLDEPEEEEDEEPVDELDEADLGQDGGHGDENIGDLSVLENPLVPQSGDESPVLASDPATTQPPVYDPPASRDVVRTSPISQLRDVVTPVLNVAAPVVKPVGITELLIPTTTHVSRASDAAEPALMALVDEQPRTQDAMRVAAVETQAPQPLSSAITAPVAIINTVVTTLLAPLLAPIGPAAPAQTPILWAVLAWVRRQFEHTFANKAPIIVANNNTELVEPDTVTGTVTAYDPDPEDRVVLATSGGDPDADITVAPDGQWSYTAPPDWDGTTAHTDTFTITATEYRGGFLGLIAPRGRSASTTVNVTIPPADSNQPPQIVATVPVGEPDEATGAITYTVTVRDHDGDTAAPTLAASQPADGTGTVGDVSYVGANADGTHSYTVTYTPDPIERVSAYYSESPLTDSFTLTAADSDPSTSDTTQTFTPTIDSAQTAVLAQSAGNNGEQFAYLNVGPDGTRYLITSDSRGDTRAVTVTALNDPTFTPVEVQGFAYTDLTFDDDGNAYLLTETGSARDGTAQTTVTAVNNPSIDPVTVPGYSTGPLVSDADGNLYLVTVTGGLSATEPNETTVTAVNNTAITPVTHVGRADEPVAIDNNGNIYLTLSSGDGFIDDIDTTVFVINDPTFEPFVIQGVPVGAVVFDGQGHAYQTVENSTGTAVFDVNKPNAEPFVVSGERAYYTVFVAPDGTTYLATDTNLPSGEDQTTVTAVNDATFVPLVVAGEIQALNAGADGTVYVTTLGYQDDDYETTVTVVGDPDATPITARGYDGAGGIVTANGNDYLVTGTNNGTGNEQTIITVVNKPDVDPIVLDGGPSNTYVAPDGTFFVTVYDPATYDETIYVVGPPGASTSV